MEVESFLRVFEERRFHLRSDDPDCESKCFALLFTVLYNNTGRLPESVAHFGFFF
jgi:hypothetical protein